MTGLESRYRVERVYSDGRPPREVPRGFVLVPRNDPAARVALRAYADACEVHNPVLAADLRALAD